MYFVLLSTIATSLLLFTSKTESSRVVTIHRPMVITQERKTPAYYLYQQAQLLQQKKSIEIKSNTTYLSSESLKPAEIKVQVAEMKLTRHEAVQQLERQLRNVATFTSSIDRDINSLAYENVIAPPPTLSPIPEEAAEPTSLSPAKKWATLKGKLELIEGVGITDHHIEIKRVQEGQVREMGSIDLNAGAYAIDIESPQGYLIVQIKDKNGLLIGEDRERLVNLQSRGSYFEGPFMRVGQPGTVAANTSAQGSQDSIGKTAAGTTNKTVSTLASSSVSVTLFDNQNTLQKPTDTFSNISTYTSTIARVFDPSQIYKNVTSIRYTADPTSTNLFTTKWVDGVVSYISDVKKIEFKSKTAPLIIGRVLSDGKPVANAQVQIDNSVGLTPIYFDQFMIPSFSQTGTSENGYFMFVGLEAGVYDVVAQRQNVYLGGQLFIAEDDSIAFQNIESLSVPRLKIVRAFDAFTSDPQVVEAISPEAEDVLETVAGTTSFQSHIDASVSEYIVRNYDRRYLPIRYVQNSRQDYVHIPLIQETWLNEIKAIKQVNELPQAGTVIGFSKDLVYDAYLVAEVFDRSNVVYFDSTGAVVAEPVRGGGFILFNVPVGAREVILQERGSDRIFSQVFNILAQQISVAHFGSE
jgi:hypothetical protein